MLEFIDIGKSFSKRAALIGIDLKLAAGKVHVFLGSSGSGKSTLLRLIMGLIRPDNGEVWVDGIKVDNSNQKEISARIGYVVQEGGLFPHLTAADNISLAARSRGWGEEKIRERLKTLFALADLDRAQLPMYPRQLSGGQRQRVGLLRALMLDPNVLLLDEPLGALDPLVRAGLQRELKKIFTRLAKTVVLVTHDIAEAAFFGDTITLFNQGRVVQHGTLRQLLTTPETPFVTEFFHAQQFPAELREYI